MNLLSRHTISVLFRVGNITLQDFKDATKKDGNFRYIFKALDPELGTVKEEVRKDVYLRLGMYFCGSSC